MKIKVDYTVEWPDPDEIGGTVEQVGVEQFVAPAGFAGWDSQTQNWWICDELDHRFSVGMPNPICDARFFWRPAA